MTAFLRARYVLAVNDLERSVAWYTAVLGFDIAVRLDGWVFLARDGIVLMIGHCADALPPSELGDHSYFAYIDVADARALHDEFQHRGAVFVKPLRDEPWQMREFGVVTVDGHRIMFGQGLEA